MSATNKGSGSRGIFRGAGTSVTTPPRNWTLPSRRVRVRKRTVTLREGRRLLPGAATWWLSRWCPPPASCAGGGWRIPGCPHPSVRSVRFASHLCRPGNVEAHASFCARHNSRIVKVVRPRCGLDPQLPGAWPCPAAPSPTRSPRRPRLPSRAPRPSPIHCPCPRAWLPGGRDRRAAWAGRELSHVRRCVPRDAAHTCRDARFGGRSIVCIGTSRRCLSAAGRARRLSDTRRIAAPGLMVTAAARNRHERHYDGTVLRVSS